MTGFATTLVAAFRDQLPNYENYGDSMLTLFRALLSGEFGKAGMPAPLHPLRSLRPLLPGSRKLLLQPRQRMLTLARQPNAATR